MACEHPRLLERRALIAVAVVLPALETGLLHAIGRDVGVALGPQVTAPAPFGVFHDLRWLLAYHPSWTWFAIAALVLVALRTLLIAILLRTAWPGADRPSFPSLVRRAAMFVAVAAVVLAPSASLLFGLAAMPVSWLLFAALPTALLIASLVHPGTSAGDWWRLPTWRSVGWTLATFAILSLGGGAVAASPPVLATLAAGATGLWNAWAWHSIMHSSVCAERARPTWPRIPVALGATLAVIIVAAAAVFGRTESTPEREREPRSVADDGIPVLVARGFSSAWDGRSPDPGRPGLEVVRYSYRGLGPDGRPLPYDSSATHRALPELVDTMAEQVSVLSERTGQPVRLLADSEGALVAQLYLATTPDAPVAAAVLTSPLLRPGRVYYPPVGEDGWGVAGGWLLGRMTGLISAISPMDFDAHIPLARSVVEHAPAVRGLQTCQVLDEQSIVLPMTAAVTTPPGIASEIPIHHVPALHASILELDRPDPLVLDLLFGEERDEDDVLEDVTRAGRALMAAWQVPSVPLGLPQPWRLPPDASLGRDGLLACDRIVDAARAWIGPRS